MDKIYAIIPVNQFANAKTRLSPFLSPEERKNLLKAMLKDIAITLKPIVDDIIIISKDEEVLAYAEELELTALVEEDHKPSKASKNGDEGPLNKAIKQAMKWCRKKTRKVIILPSDIPLIGKTNIKLLIDQAKNLDFIIVPSKGGGTNAFHWFMTHSIWHLMLTPLKTLEKSCFMETEQKPRSIWNHLE